MSAAEVIAALETGCTAAGQPYQRAGDAYRIRMACGLWFTISAEDFERVGAFRWHPKRNKALPGKIYVQRTVRQAGSGRNGAKTSIALHRFILGVTDPEVFVDHRHGDPLNNVRDNLRITNSRGNSTNVVSSKNQKAGGYKGVGWSKGAGK